MLSRAASSFFKKAPAIAQRAYSEMLPRYSLPPLPNSSGQLTPVGQIQRMRHDQQPEESSEVYKNRCASEIQTVIDNNPGKYVFLCTSTFVNFTQPQLSQEKRNQAVDKILNAFINEENISGDPQKAVVPGHIAFYTQEGNYRSHLPANKMPKEASQKAALLTDISTSITENQLSSTYVVTLDKDFLPNGEKILARQPKPYHWGAYTLQDEKTGQTIETSNCCTELHEFMGPVNRTIMNPLATMRELILHVYSEYNIERYEAQECIDDAGLNRDIHAISNEQYEHAMNPENITLKTPGAR